MAVPAGSLFRDLRRARLSPHSPLWEPALLHLAGLRRCAPRPESIRQWHRWDSLQSRRWRFACLMPPAREIIGDEIGASRGTIRQLRPSKAALRPVPLSPNLPHASGNHADRMRSLPLLSISLDSINDFRGRCLCAGTDFVNVSDASIKSVIIVYIQARCTINPGHNEGHCRRPLRNPTITGSSPRYFRISLGTSYHLGC